MTLPSTTVNREFGFTSTQFASYSCWSSRLNSVMVNRSVSMEIRFFALSALSGHAMSWCENMTPIGPL